MKTHNGIKCSFLLKFKHSILCGIRLSYRMTISRIGYEYWTKNKKKIYALAFYLLCLKR